MSDSVELRSFQLTLTGDGSPAVGAGVSSMPTGAVWNGDSGTVLELLGVRFVFMTMGTVGVANCHPAGFSPMTAASDGSTMSGGSASRNTCTQYRSYAYAALSPLGGFHITRMLATDKVQYMSYCPPNGDQKIQATNLDQPSIGYQDCTGGTGHGILVKSPYICFEAYSSLVDSYRGTDGTITASGFSPHDRGVLVMLYFKYKTVDYSTWVGLIR